MSNSNSTSWAEGGANSDRLTLGNELWREHPTATSVRHERRGLLT